MVFAVGSDRPTKITADILHIVEAQMQLDDETTAVQPQKILVDEGHPLSLKTILASRTKLGWTFRGSAYCQLIRYVNKAKRLAWAQISKKPLTTSLKMCCGLMKQVLCLSHTEDFAVERKDLKQDQSLQVRALILLLSCV